MHGHVMCITNMYQPYKTFYPHLYTVVDCGRPPFVFFSGADTTATTVGTVITYTCFSGRRLVGDRQRTCLASGEWSGDTPQCERTYTVCVLPVHSLDGTR